MLTKKFNKFLKKGKDVKNKKFNKKTKSNKEETHAKMCYSYKKSGYIKPYGTNLERRKKP